MLRSNSPRLLSHRASLTNRLSQVLESFHKFRCVQEAQDRSQIGRRPSIEKHRRIRRQPITVAFLCDEALDGEVVSEDSYTSFSCSATLREGCRGVYPLSK